MAETPTETQPPEFIDQVLADLGYGKDDKKDNPVLPEQFPSMTIGEAAMLNAEREKAKEEEGKNEKEAKVHEDVQEGAKGGAKEDEGEGAGKEAKPEDKSKPDKKEQPAAPAAVEVKSKKDATKEFQDAVDARINEAMARPPEIPKAEPKATEKPAEEDDYEKTLGEIEREELGFARFAAQRDPALKEYPKQFVDYLKKVDAYVEKERKENPERKFDETDDEWAKWQRENKPKVSPVLRRKLERAQIMEEATLAAEAKIREKYAPLERRQELLEKRPVIEKVAKQFAQSLDSLMEQAPEGQESLIAPIIKHAKEVGWEMATEEDPVFAPIIKSFGDTANELATHYISLVNGTQEFDPNNKQHLWIADFIQKQGEHFATTGGEKIVRRDAAGNEQRFLPRHKYFELASTDPAKAAQHWTFDDREVLDRLALNAKNNAEKAIKLEQDKLTKAGFERRKPESTKKELPKPERNGEPEKDKNGSPKAVASVAPGAATTRKVSGPTLMSEEELKILVPGLVK